MEDVYGQTVVTGHGVLSSLSLSGCGHGMRTALCVYQTSTERVRKEIPTGRARSRGLWEPLQGERRGKGLSRSVRLGFGFRWVVLAAWGQGWGGFGRCFRDQPRVALC